MLYQEGKRVPNRFNIPCMSFSHLPASSQCEHNICLQNQTQRACFFPFSFSFFQSLLVAIVCVFLIFWGRLLGLPSSQIIFAFIVFSDASGIFK